MYKRQMEKGSKRRYMDLLFSCETGQFQVILDRSDKVYTLSHIEGKHGPLEAWDLYVGARVNVLGRTTTLMQASGPTLDWLDYHCQRLKRARNALKRELKKYSMKVRKQASVRRTRTVLDCTDVVLVLWSCAAACEGL